MKAIYIYSTSNKDYRSDGEAKKVFSQINAFREAGVEMELLDTVLGRKIDKLLYRLPFSGVYSKNFILQCAKAVADVDFVYIRKNIFDRTYYNLLQALRKANPRVKIVVEIPTYPYFQEWNRVIDQPFLWKEKNVIPKVRDHCLVDYYLTLTGDETIFGIPAIQFDNCISLSDYAPKKNLQDPKEIHLVGVALLAFWHGYDRIIEGMHRYYQDTTNDIRVFFHIVGDGPEYSNLKRLIEQYGLEKYVILEGRQKGENLDHFYDISNIGVGSFGLYRIGLQDGRSLKLREYCAKGIPFIKAGGDEAFDDYPYCLSFSNDNEPVDIKRVVAWAKSLDYVQAVDSMRMFAKHRLSWEKYINIILQKINKVEVP